LRIDSLLVKNFRNYEEAVFHFAAEGNIICGPNGVGKTNLLEAMSYGAFGKSVRFALDADILGFQKPFFRINGQYVIHGDRFTIDSTYETKKKLIRINRQPAHKLSELYQYVKVVYFSPEDIEIISGSPRWRRQFLDQAIAQYDCSYIDNLRHYLHVLHQRNALLKTDYDISVKRSWDEQYASAALSVLKSRASYIAVFLPVLQRYYQQYSLNCEELSFDYNPSLLPNEPIEAMLEQLTAWSVRERQQQRTLLGPHLDDIHFKLNDNSARVYASQGQKRSLAIALRFAQAFLLTEKNGDFPIVMFDDVLADLDHDRARAICNQIRDAYQIFIATPNKEMYSYFQLPLIEL